MIGARMKMRSKLVVSFLHIAVLLYFQISFGSEIGKTGKNSVSGKNIAPQKRQKIWEYDPLPNISILYPECWRIISQRSVGNHELVSFLPTDACSRSPLGRWEIRYGEFGDIFFKIPEPKRLSKKIKLNGVNVNFRELVDYSVDGDPTWQAQFKCGDALETIDYFRDKRIEPKKHVVPDVLKLAVKGFRCKK